MKRLLQGFAGGTDLHLWNNEAGSVGEGPWVDTLVLRDPTWLADGYFRGRWCNEVRRSSGGRTAASATSGFLWRH